MSKDDTSSSDTGELTTTKGGSLGWVKIVGGTLLLIVGLLLLMKLAGFLIKWGLLLLLAYGAWRLVRHWLGSNSSDDQETVLQIDDDRDINSIGLLEQERDLEDLKVKMKGR